MRFWWFGKQERDSGSRNWDGAVFFTVVINEQTFVFTGLGNFSFLLGASLKSCLSVHSLLSQLDPCNSSLAVQGWDAESALWVHSKIWLINNISPHFCLKYASENGDRNEAIMHLQIQQRSMKEKYAVKFLVCCEEAFHGCLPLPYWLVNDNPNYSSSIMLSKSNRWPARKLHRTYKNNKKKNIYISILFKMC